VSRYPGVLCTLSLFTCLLVTPPSPAHGTTATGAGTVAADAPAVPRIDTPPLLDGRLDDPAWRAALALLLSWEVAPGENVPAPVRTTCYVACDGSNLYVAFDAPDPDPAAVVADLADRDDAWRDDYAGFYLDTFLDHRRGYGFWVSAGGVQMDLRRDELAEETEDIAWDARWHSAAAVTDSGYVVEMAIPLAELRFPRDRGEQRWGFLARRVRPRSTRQELSLRPEDRDDPCLLCQAAVLRLPPPADRERDLTITPTWTAGRTDSGGFPDGDLRHGPWRGEAGVSLRWGLRSDLTLAATLNPDFSQVEADELLLDINTRFALEYTEKRPFFLEGAEVFATPLPAVYSRSMNDPDAGLKLTGRRGRDAVGLLVVRDHTPWVLLAGNQSSLETPLGTAATTGVLRWRRDVGESSAVGALATAREGDGYHNRVAGLDGTVRWHRSHRLTWQWLWSDTRDSPDLLGGHPPTPTGGGSAGLIRYELDSRDWSALAEYQRLEPSFRQDTGFYERLDLKRWQAGLWRSWWGDAGHWFQRLGLGAGWEYGEDFRGRLTDRTTQVELNYLGPRHARAWFALQHTDERFADRLFGQDMLLGKVGLRPTGHLELWLKGWHGDGIDVANIRPGRETGWGAGVEYSPAERLFVSLEGTRLDFDAVGADLFEASLAAGQLRFHLDRRTFLRAILQYRRYDRHPENYAVPVPRSQDQLSSQLLLSYKLDPQTLVFLGMTDLWLGFDPGNGAPAVDRTLDGRTFFLKLSYAWRP